MALKRHTHTHTHTHSETHMYIHQAKPDEKQMRRKTKQKVKLLCKTEPRMRSRHKLHPLTSFTLFTAGPRIRFIAADYEGKPYLSYR